MPTNPARVDDETTFRKILAFASSAGHTITNRDALEVIRSICRERLDSDERAGAIVRHADRVRAVVGADIDRAFGVPVLTDGTVSRG